MACDLQATGSYKFKLHTKCMVAENNSFTDQFSTDRVVVGGAGNLQELANVWPYILNPEGKCPKTRNLQLILLAKGTGIFYSENFSSWVQIGQPYFSIGSGAPYAQAAMETGADPMKAVKIAAKLDTATGMGFKKFVL